MHPASPQEQTRTGSRLPSRIAAVVLRVAAVILIVAFFLPWGQVWVRGSGCSTQAEGSTLGEVSGWEMAVGTDLLLPDTAGAVNRDTTRPVDLISLSAQPVAFLIPGIAIIFFVLPFVAATGLITRIMTYVVTLPGSAFVGFLLFHVIDSVSVPSSQQQLLGPTSGEVGYPKLEFDAGGAGWWLSLAALTLIGVGSIVGLVVENRAVRPQQQQEPNATTDSGPPGPSVGGSEPSGCYASQPCSPADDGRTR